MQSNRPTASATPQIANGSHHAWRFRRTDAIWLVALFVLLVLTLAIGHRSGLLQELEESYGPPMPPRSETPEGVAEPGVSLVQADAPSAAGNSAGNDRYSPE